MVETYASRKDKRITNFKCVEKKITFRRKCIILEAVYFFGVQRVEHRRVFNNCKSRKEVNISER